MTPSPDSERMIFAKARLKEWQVELIVAVLAVVWALRWASTVNTVTLSNLSERLQSNELLLNTIGIGITAVSILFPVTLGIYAVFLDKPFAVGARPFFRASVCYLLSMGFGLWAAADIPVASHRTDAIALATDPTVLILGAFQGWFLVGGLIETLIGARSTVTSHANTVN